MKIFKLEREGKPLFSLPSALENTLSWCRNVVLKIGYKCELHPANTNQSIESSKDESIMGNQEISKKYITSFPSYKESPMRFLNDSAFISRTFSVHLLLRIPNPI